MSDPPKPASGTDGFEIDLSSILVPEWAKGNAPSEALTKLTKKFGDGEAVERRPGREFDSHKRRPSGRDRGDRRPSSDQASRSGRRRGPDRGGREKSDRRPPPAPPLAGWKVDFRPDPHGLDGLARQIRGSAKAYQLFDIAHLVLEKPERYQIRFHRESENSPPLFQALVDGSLWMTVNDAVRHLLATQVEKFYRREQIQSEAPKGNFAVVAVCGVSGTLLGPPNLHDYQTKLIALHRERFNHLPFDVFKSKIRMMRDDETIQRWKDSASTRDVFYPIVPAPPPRSPEEAGPVPSEIESTGDGDSETPEDSPEAIVPEAGVDNGPGPVDGDSAVPEDRPAEVDAGVSDADAEALPGTDDPGLALRSPEELFAHFMENHARRAVRQVESRATVSGQSATQNSCPEIRRLARHALDDLHHHPLPLAMSIGRSLQHKGLQVFKAHGKLTYVAAVRPRYLDRSSNPLSENLARILDALEAAARSPRDIQWKSLLALCPPGADAAAHEIAITNDLLWLLREGYVVDYARRALEITPGPKAEAPKSTPTRPDSV